MAETRHRCSNKASLPCPMFWTTEESGVCLSLLNQKGLHTSHIHRTTTGAPWLMRSRLFCQHESPCFDMKGHRAAAVGQEAPQAVWVPVWVGRLETGRCRSMPCYRIGRRRRTSRAHLPPSQMDQMVHHMVREVMVRGPTSRSALLDELKLTACVARLSVRTICLTAS
jgi:hypothetical protein